VPVPTPDMALTICVLARCCGALVLAAPQALMLYAAVVSASTPVAMRYLYRTAQPPQPAVLAAVQTGLAAAILCVLCGTWYMISGLHRQLKAGEGRSGRRALSDAEAAQRGDSALNMKLHEVRAAAGAGSQAAAPVCQRALVASTPEPACFCAALRLVSLGEFTGDFLREFIGNALGGSGVWRASPDSCRPEARAAELRVRCVGGEAARRWRGTARAHGGRALTASRAA